MAGHSAGAFTNADREGTAWFEKAGDGTLLPQDIGESDAATQANFMTVLEEKKYQRMGDLKEFYLKGTIVFTSNVNIEDAVAEGKFREDLLNRVDEPIHIPPLRERKEDIDAMVTGLCKEGIYPMAFRNEDALRVLKNLEWHHRNSRALVKTLDQVKRSGDYSVANISNEAAKRQRVFTKNKQKEILNDLDMEEKDILAFLSNTNGRDLKRSEIEAHLNGLRMQAARKKLSKSVVNKRLGRLLAERLVHRVGDGANTHYRAVL